MTDNEIIKALECCGSEKGNLCTQCPKFKKLGYDCNENDFFNDALDLINRQKAEIERLEKDLIKCKLEKEMLHQVATEIQTVAIKDFAERVKRKCIIDRDYEILQEDDIDNLVKEMTEVEE